jgi:integrase
MSCGRAPGPGSLAKRPLPKGGSSWTLTFTDARGKRRRIVLGSDRRVAERRWADVIRRRDLELAGLGGEAGMELPLKEIKRLHLADLALRVTPHHHRNVECILDRALAAIPAERVRDLRPHDVLVYRQTLVAEGLSHRWANLAAERIRVMLAWAERCGLIAESPLKRGLDRLPEGARYVRCRRRALTEDEVERFLDAVTEDDLHCQSKEHTRRTSKIRHRGHWPAEGSLIPRVPQRPFLEVLVTIGARYGEAILLDWGHVDLDRGLLTFRAVDTKSGQERVVPLGQRLVLSLLALRAVHEKILGRTPTATDKVFLSPEGQPWARASTNINRILRRILGAAGIDRVDADGRKIDLHALRGSAASRMVRAKVPVPVTARILGHTDARTTLKHYVHVEVDDMREAIDSLPRTGGAKQKVGA